MTKYNKHRWQQRTLGPCFILLCAAPVYADFGDRFSDLLKARAKETVSEVMANQAAQVTDRVLSRAADKVLGPPAETESNQLDEPVKHNPAADDKAPLEEADPFVD